MAVVLRSNSDLVYLPDHGFVGDEGALRILIHITRQVNRLDISHNLLGNEGIKTLFAGLTTLRARYSVPTGGLVPPTPREEMWGLRDVNLAFNGIGDQALDVVLGYAKKDGAMRSIWVGGNDIQLNDHLDSIVNSINASHIESFSIVNTRSLVPSSVCAFFSLLDAPRLRQLHLSTCDLPETVAGAISSFLRSSRSRYLERLELNGNCLGAVGVAQIIDAIEESHFGLRQLGVFANDTRRAVDEDEVSPMPLPAEIRHAEERALGEQLGRLPILLERNRLYTRRIRRAAQRAIAPARIILNARSLTADETAQRVLSSVGSTSSSSSSYTSPDPTFPLLDLPLEVVHHVVRHTSGDAVAFSEAQFARLRAEAVDRESMKRTRRVLEERFRGQDKEGRLRLENEIREAWLRRGGWDKWESGSPRRGSKSTGVDGE
ncbi:hypothetical protein BCR39DRAFT_535829 [Naematelia encephala]|uniref:RNI-like protein n=1 Tax=Naematelia encephala TaxID=71784 RepID=A0A1Y2B020_9TREE|nr:hypothetical protein BCR39DRAFT_535829 [Naematelia encephala]